MNLNYAFVYICTYIFNRIYTTVRTLHFCSVLSEISLIIHFVYAISCGLDNDDDDDDDDFGFSM